MTADESKPDTQPPIPDTPATPAAAGPDQPRPPSDLLNAKVQPAMPGRADMTDTPPDAEQKQLRREDINPSRAREQPPER